MSLLAAAEVESFAVLLADKWDKFGKTLARSSVVSRSTVDRTVTHQHNAMRLILVKKGNVFTSRRNARNVSAVLSPEILLPSDLPSRVNGILWEMPELITQERTAVGSSNFKQQ